MKAAAPEARPTSARATTQKWGRSDEGNSERECRGVLEWDGSVLAGHERRQRNSDRALGGRTGRAAIPHQGQQRDGIADAGSDSAVGGSSYRDGRHVGHTVIAIASARPRTAWPVALT